MSDSSHKQYLLQGGLYGLCTSVWDPSSKKYIKANESEILKCCLDSCRPTIDLCYKTCDESKEINKNCKKICKNILKACSETCQLSSPQGLWGNINPFYKSSFSYGCGDQYSSVFDKDCLKKHKDNILKKCKRNCSSDYYVNCENHCKTSYNNAISEDLLDNSIMAPIYDDVEDDDVEDDDVEDDDVEDDSMVYFAYSLSIGTVLLGLYIIFKK